MKIYKKSILLLIMSLVCIIGLALYCKPMLIKCMLGEARILFSKVNAEVFLNGKVSSEAYVFHQTERFDGSPVNWLILWIPSHNIGRGIFVLDLYNEIVGLPNASIYDYDLLFGQLIQSENGDGFVDITSSKVWPEHNPSINITEKTIEFILPDCDWLPCTSIKVATHNIELKSDRLKPAA